jgi:two-component system OmpR family response regulator
MACNHIDLIISDIMMPNIDGYELAESLRNTNHELPILFITAKDSYKSKEKSFDIGIDDYMVKPIDTNEMLLRVKSLLRRSKIVSSNKLTIGDVVLDNSNLSVSNGSDVIAIPQKEFQLLFMLLSYPEQIFTRMQIMDKIWGYDADSDERTVDVHIKRLREKFKDYTEFEIITIRGLGYKAVRKA